MSKKKEKTQVKCRECKNSILYLYERDGVVIADCEPRKEREVANAPRLCEQYIPSNNEKEIIKLYEMF